MESFYRAFLTPELKLLGKTLKPFCFGHQVVLKALESPFVFGNRDIKSIDLIIALKVCSEPYPFQPKMKLTFKEKIQCFYLNKNPMALFSYCLSFQSFLNEHMHCPEYWQNSESSGKTIYAPDEVFYIANLVKSGIDYKKAWEMSIGEATWVNAALFELSGNDSAYTDPIDDQLNPPDINDWTNDEIYIQAVKDLGEKRAQEFMELRQKNVRS